MMWCLSYAGQTLQKHRGRGTSSGRCVLVYYIIVNSTLTVATTTKQKIRARAVRTKKVMQGHAHARSLPFSSRSFLRHKYFYLKILKTLHTHPCCQKYPTKKKTLSKTRSKSNTYRTVLLHTFFYFPPSDLTNHWFLANTCPPHKIKSLYWHSTSRTGSNTPHQQPGWR